MSLIGFLSIAWASYPTNSIQSHSDNLQAPPRHLPDTFQTHSRHPPILNNPRQLGEKEEANVYESDWVFINCLHFIPPRHYPESLTQPPDTSQTPSRHPSNTPKYSTFWPIQGNKQKSSQLIKISLLRCLSIVCTSYPQTVSRVTHTTPRHPSDTFQTPFRHSEAPGREGTSWSKYYSN